MDQPSPTPQYTVRVDREFRAHVGRVLADGQLTGFRTGYTTEDRARKLAEAHIASLPGQLEALLAKRVAA